MKLRGMLNDIRQLLPLLLLADGVIGVLDRNAELVGLAGLHGLGDITFPQRVVGLGPAAELAIDEDAGDELFAGNVQEERAPGQVRGDVDLRAIDEAMAEGQLRLHVELVAGDLDRHPIRPSPRRATCGPARFGPPPPARHIGRPATAPIAAPRCARCPCRLGWRTPAPQPSCPHRSATARRACATDLAGTRPCRCTARRSDKRSCRRRSCPSPPWSRAAGGLAACACRRTGSASPILIQATSHQKPSSMRSVVRSCGLIVFHSPWSTRQSKALRTNSKPMRFQISYFPADGAANS